MTASMEKKRLLEILKTFSNGRVLVVGDIMLDQFIYGTVERISPEAPVPVVQVEEEVFRLGGAANVAANLNTLGAEVILCGVLGEKIWGDEVIKMCSGLGINIDGIVRSDERNTILKTRIIAGHQQVVRFDKEVSKPASKNLTARIVESIKKLEGRFDAVIVSDYGKGIIGKTLLDYLRKLKSEKNLPVTVDPKVGNFHHYRGLTLMTPNQLEAGQMLGRKIINEPGPILEGGRALLKKLSLESLVITRGEEGMTVLPDEKSHIHIPTRAQQVFDVTGAGDTVIATLTLGLACGAKLVHAAEVANYAAGIVVGKLGTATTDVKELARAIRGAEK